MYQSVEDGAVLMWNDVTGHTVCIVLHAAILKCKQIIASNVTDIQLIRRKWLHDHDS